MGSREWGVGSGEWGVGSGEWGMGSGEWGVGGVGGVGGVIQNLKLQPYPVADTRRQVSASICVHLQFKI